SRYVLQKERKDTKKKIKISICISKRKYICTFALQNVTRGFAADIKEDMDSMIPIYILSIY
ncbi:MAG: hypothetical protein ACI4UA_08175, partial [Bacteroidaceae bacterium]